MPATGPIDVLSQTPDRLARIIGERDADRLRARPYPDKWTPLEVIGHFVDAEWGFGWRTRVTLGEESGEIAHWDQDGWVANQRHNERDPAELVETFAQLRRANLATWKRLTPDDLERTAVSRIRGPMTLAALLQSFADHDRHHLDQLTRYLEKAGRSQGQSPVSGAREE